MIKFKIYRKFASTLAMVVLGSLSVGMTLKYNSEIMTERFGKSLVHSCIQHITASKIWQTLQMQNTLSRFVVSPAESNEKPAFHGFFFFNCSANELFQFDPSGRYMLGMRIFIEGREVQPTDKGEIGIFDLHDNKKWIKIGETTAWNYQQGCRLQWIPGSLEEIIWNDRSMDGKKAVSRIYNTKNNKTRMLPIPIYTISPDGSTALSINFERIVYKGGCNYVGIKDPFENQWAPNEIGIWKMDMNTGEVKMILSLREMAKTNVPQWFAFGYSWKDTLLFQRRV